MTDWMMAHPWMTFFLLYAAIESAGSIVSAVCKAIVAYKQAEKERRQEHDR